MNSREMHEYTVLYSTALCCAVLLRVGDFEDPSFDLFQWCLVQNKKALAFVFFEQCRVRAVHSLTHTYIHSYIQSHRFTCSGE